MCNLQTERIRLNTLQWFSAECLCVAGRQTLPCYLASEPHMPNTDLEVHDKYTGKVAYRVAQATAEDIKRCAPRTSRLHRLGALV